MDTGSSLSGPGILLVRGKDRSQIGFFAQEYVLMHETVEMADLVNFLAGQVFD